MRTVIFQETSNREEKNHGTAYKSFQGGKEGGGSNLEEDNVRMLELSHDAGLSEEVGACLVAGARLHRLDRHTVQII